MVLIVSFLRQTIKQCSDGSARYYSSRCRITFHLDSVSYKAKTGMVKRSHICLIYKAFHKKTAKKWGGGFGRPFFERFHRNWPINKKPSPGKGGWFQCGQQLGSYFFNSLNTFVKTSSLAESRRLMISRLISVVSQSPISFATASSETSI